MSKNEIILIGGGGHCISCIDVIESNSAFKIAGIVDQKDKIGETILGYSIIGCDDDLKKLREKYKYAIITVGQIKSPHTRIKLFNLLKELQFELPAIIASTAYVSKHSKIGEGTIIMHQSMVNADSTIGDNCIVNSKALIEHGSQIGNHCHISTGSIINGDVTIKDNCFMGSNAACVNGISIAENVCIGINSLVTEDIKDKGVYVGNPVKKIRS